MARKKRQRRSRENSSMYPNPGRGGYGQHKKKNHWENFKKNSESFERFYKAQQIVPEEEFPLFVNAMKQDLPSTFRITGTRSHAHELLQVMRKLLDDLLNVNSDGATVNPPTPLPWYPDDLAWQVNFTKKFIRKSSCMSKFHQFLVHETESGNISRQEAVSMIPPLLLDVKPGQKILDACAAPGSKTVQLIELLHDDDSSGIPDGLVVANELQNRRCYMLVHQSKRLHSPCCVITNHDAAMFPEMFVKGKDGSKSPLQFDRILCDVPCSGDGTMRKNPLIWRKWTPVLGLGLHRLQLRILTRAVEMLATGGRIVYSTCTMNPIENEAVICTLLQKAEGSLELVDVSSELHGLKRSPGLMTWKLMTKTMEVVDNCDPGTEHYSKGFKPQMLAPPEEVMKELHIERCMRVYPHQQDTGGFFIAVIEKKRPARWENENRFSENRRLLPWETEADWQSKMREKANAYSLREKSQKPSLDDNQGELGGSGESESKMMDTASSQDEEASTSVHVTEINSGLRTRSDNDDDSGDNDDDIEGVGAFNEEQPELIEIVEGDKGEGNVIELDESDEALGCDVNEEDDSAARAACSTKNDNNGGEIPGDSAAQEEGQPPRKKAKVDRGFKEDPFVFLEEGDEHWAQIKQFYGIDESFPVNQLLVRSVEGKKRNIYFVSKAVRDVMELVDDRVKVVNTGMKVITRSEADGVGCCFRLMQEGIEVLLPFIHKRKVLITQKDMIILLTEDRPFFTELSSTTREQFDRIEGMGCIVYLYEPNGPYSKSEDTIGCRILFCGWKARVSTRVQISKFHRFHYMTLCGIPPGQKMKQSPLETNQEAPAEVDDEAKEIAPEKTEEEPEKTDEDEDHPGYLGDILNVEVPEGALDVGFI